MEYFRYLNRVVQNWQDREWLKLDDTTPYNFFHNRHRQVLPFVSDYHFKRYLGKNFARGGNKQAHKNSKRKKLYWFLHRDDK